MAADLNLLHSRQIIAASSLLWLGNNGSGSIAAMTSNAGGSEIAGRLAQFPGATAVSMRSDSRSALVLSKR